MKKIQSGMGIIGIVGGFLLPFVTQPPQVIPAIFMVVAGLFLLARMFSRGK